LSALCYSLSIMMVRVDYRTAIAGASYRQHDPVVASAPSSKSPYIKPPAIS
jgi:hypothetical protein